jgi:hypothetical protein
MGALAGLCVGLVIGFLIGGEFTLSWLRGSILKNHPHPAATEFIITEAKKEESVE